MYTLNVYVAPHFGVYQFVSREDMREEIRRMGLQDGDYETSGPAED